jgi:hypothetical protein
MKPSADVVERGKLSGASEERAAEGGVGLGLALEEDDASSLDRGAIEHGHAWASGVIAARTLEAFASRQPVTSVA